ncbi:hypothetical protein AVEN_168012-1 [Araneus ventricosus]|uniref:Uncharacterized protein n=1 Tax=Araneus ventricosus TaxID=182803 RepID=A0A4Y2JSY6_ARAVE|nr:hypothetical protein AVEN_168012-1 [Araneus ventricosus]
MPFPKDYLLFCWVSSPAGIAGNGKVDNDGNSAIHLNAPYQIAILILLIPVYNKNVGHLEREVNKKIVTLNPTENWTPCGPDFALGTRGLPIFCWASHVLLVLTMKCYTIETHPY